MAFDAHVNFGYSTVATAPSPASSGTSLVVAAGEGADFPTPPFNAVVWPAGANPRKSTSEVVRVTNISTDTFTITRAQESSTARSIIVGDQIADAATAKSLTDIEGPVSDGWIDDTGDTWTYASADAPTFTFTISGDKTASLTPGKRIKLTQSTVKYFIVTAVSVSAGTTTVTVYGGTDYTLANSAISANYHSAAKAPDGFPLNPTKWTVELADTGNRSQSSPVNGTWYNLGSLSISLPIGCWRVFYEVLATVTSTTRPTSIQPTLSTANNTESDTELSAVGWTDMTTGGAGFIGVTLRREKIIAVAAKTSYFLNAKTFNSSGSSLNFRGDLAKTIVRAVCAYL